MKNIFILLTLFPLMSFATAPAGYSKVPNAGDRSKDTKYMWVREFPRLELVKENNGTPLQASDYIKNIDLKSKIQAGKYKSLQVRDLFIIPEAATVSDGKLVIPFTVSVKHTQKNNSVVNQGTIEVEGQIFVYDNNNKLNVEVSKFFDSQKAEELGRKFGINNFNEEITLDFALEVVKPVLEGYYNSNPEQINSLILLTPNRLR